MMWIRLQTSYSVFAGKWAVHRVSLCNSCNFFIRMCDGSEYVFDLKLYECIPGTCKSQSESSCSKLTRTSSNLPHRPRNCSHADHISYEKDNKHSSCSTRHAQPR
ncbi:unnamed protein product [Albugo candida]|uniref:Uncharacterized protein n=1 Tax=Albugo candida TaxID=65357 RepID=A0A024GD92_9STRA|nr:unnamed protein product [Albugo candida]|eukprot:CCI44658.1 unnamed protein product [Albugo candida]